MIEKENKTSDNNNARENGVKIKQNKIKRKELTVETKIQFENTRILQTWSHLKCLNFLSRI